MIYRKDYVYFTNVKHFNSRNNNKNNKKNNKNRNNNKNNKKKGNSAKFKKL